MMLAVAWHISWQMVKEAAVPVTVSDGGLYGQPSECSAEKAGINKSRQEKAFLTQQLSRLNSGETIKNQALAGHNYLGLAGMMACICRWSDL